MRNQKRPPTSWLRSAGLAALCGARTMWGPVFLSKHSRSLRRFRPLILCLAAGEIVIDKAPGIPDRTMPAPLIARALMGSLVAVASRPRSGPGPALLAAVLGAAAASAGTAVTFQLRRMANRRLGGSALANLVSGAVEDGLALAGGRWLTRV
jgi:uncharacterized membrane protein